MNKLLNNIILSIAISLIGFLIFIQFLNILFSLLFSFVILIICSVFLFKTKLNNLNILNMFVVTAFLLMLIVPFVAEKDLESLEKRQLAEFPEWRWSNVWEFFKNYQKYLDDRFAFRNSLIDTFGKIKYEMLQLSNLTENVAIGKDDWLFYHDKEYMKEVSKPFTTKELQLLHYNLVVTTKWFAQYGIKYYLTIPPIKPRIYPEKLPDYMRVAMHFSRLDQLNKYLQLNSEINIIDLRKELIEAKKKEVIYFNTDTHWNERGAFIGYTKIINSMNSDFHELKPININKMKQTPTEYYSGDLLAILGYKSKKYTLQYVLSVEDSIKATQIYASDPPGSAMNKFEIWETTNSLSNLKIYVVRDSYSENLKRFLSLNFSKSIYAWMPKVPVKEVIEEKPAIVLHEILERFTFEYLNLPPEIKNDTAFTNQFNIEDF